MPRLWMPDVTPYPDVNNIYDMAYAMQEQLVVMPSREMRIRSAHLAIRAIGEIFETMEEQQRSLALHAGTVLLAADTETAEVAHDVGIRGILDEISYIEVPGISLGLSLVIDTYQTFTLHNPEEIYPACATLRAPIIGIQYIESAA